MKLQKLCAYNQSRECFLGLEVAVVDFSCADLNKLLEKLTLKSGEGIWIVPFRGMPETSSCLPLDLIYLDKDCRVIDVVESFPTFRAAASSSLAASVLGLPIHSISSSQTQSGDQLLLCSAEEMQRNLEKFSGSDGVADAVQGAVLLREKPLWSDGPGVVNLEDHTGDEHFKPKQPYEMDLIKPEMKKFVLPTSWLKRWWSPDPRKAPRTRAPGLAAYYWTGATPKAHAVRDISATGLYLVTEERWYPGTLILMTLQEKGDEEQNAEHSIAVRSRAVRWGTDGVGLQFIPFDASAARDGMNSVVEGVNQKQFNQFLKRLQKSDGYERNILQREECYPILQSGWFAKFY